MRALLAVLLVGCAANPAVTERCAGSTAIAGSPFCVSRKEAATFCDLHARPDGGACVPIAPCGAGEVRDLLKNQCVRVLSKNGDTEVLDAGRWTRVIVGPDGGEGSGYLCAALAADPAAFQVPPRGSLALRLTVDLTFANNELAHAHAFVQGADDATRSTLASPSAAKAIGAALEAIVQPLRGSGAISSAASASATVRCVIM